ncbi:MAG: MFS transporter [Dehalococcoidia bacterium]
MPRLRLLPASAGADARRLLLARALRGTVDGFVSVMLASYLNAAGYSPVEISAIVTATLLGSAALSLALGVLGYHFTRRQLLFVSAGLMVMTGVGFAFVTNFWVLLVVAVVGTLNPSSNDVSIFLPTEQSLLSDAIDNRDRTAIFARYNVAGVLSAAFGALGVVLPGVLANAAGWSLLESQRLSFLAYAVAGLVLFPLYARLTVEETAGVPARTAPLRKARRAVVKLAALFSIDAFGGGFLVHALIALWLFRRFDLDIETTGSIFFGFNVMSALSQFLSPYVARRVGLINTIVFTQMPANITMLLAAFAPTAPIAVALLMVRMFLNQMDQPARQSYTMAVVPPEERAAAASVTHVPRGLASALAPLITGALLTASSFGWPLIIGSTVKLIYNGLLLWQFRAHPAPEELERRPASATP